MYTQAVSSIDQVQWDAQDLIPAVAQDIDSGEVLMLAWMNREALAKTLDTGYAVYWSRSRQSLWFKGETSGNTQRIHQIWLDCDADALLLQVKAQGGIACHTGRPSCFFQALPNPHSTNTSKNAENTDTPSPTVEPFISERAPFSYNAILHQLATLIQSRKNQSAEHSYIARLFALGDDALLKKIGEEATEVVLAAKEAAYTGKEATSKLVSEMADLWFHCLIVLGRFDLPPTAVLQELARRQGVSGLEEKARRSNPLDSSTSH